MRSASILASMLVCLTSAFAQMSRQDLADRFESSARQLSAQGVEYGEAWTPPGQASAWTMDCSNTARWLYAEALALSLPRTASDQYEMLRSQRRLWPASALSRLKPGDLLFWENTYKPKRKPPITHVMVYLGRDACGRMIMAGSQGSRGVDVYTFDPRQPMGGYHWFLWFKRKGKFVAYGRPA